MRTPIVRLGWLATGLGVLLALVGSFILLDPPGTTRFNSLARWLVLVGGTVGLLRVVAFLWSHRRARVPLWSRVAVGFLAGLLAFILFSPIVCVSASHRGPSLECESLGGVDIQPGQLGDLTVLALALPVVVFTGLFGYVTMAGRSRPRSDATLRSVPN